MKILLFPIITIMTILFFSCSEFTSKKKFIQPNARTLYLKNLEKGVIDSFTKREMTHFLDTGKYYFYNHYADIKIDSLLNQKNNSNIIGQKNKYLGEFKLIPTFFSFDSINNMLNINFAFVINDSMLLTGNLGYDYGYLPDGINIDLNKKCFKSFSSGAWNFYTRRNDATNDFQQVTSQLKKFVNNNLTTLDTSYVNLLKKNKEID